MTDTELQAVVNAIKSANGNGHRWWGTWERAVIFVVSMLVTGFGVWHQMDKRLEIVERQVAATEQRVKGVEIATETIKDTTRRIENALGRVEEVVWKKR